MSRATVRLPSGRTETVEVSDFMSALLSALAAGDTEECDRLLAMQDRAVAARRKQAQKGRLSSGSASGGRAR